MRLGSVLLVMTTALACACTRVDAQGTRAGTPIEAQRAPRPSSERAVPPWGGLSVVERGDPHAQRALVLLHGWGATGDDLVPLAEELTRATPMRVIVPAAPIAMSHGGRAWYDLHAADSDAQAARARTQLEGVIATLEARGVPASRIVIGGFSQGAILSIEVGLARRTPLAGLALLSGRALSHPPRAYRALAGVPVFLSHGRQDERIAFSRSEAFRERASEAGAVLEHHPFDGGHEIPPLVVAALMSWLARTLGS